MLLLLCLELVTVMILFFCHFAGRTPSNSSRWLLCMNVYLWWAVSDSHYRSPQSGVPQYQWTILACFKHRGDYDHRYVPGILKHSKCQNTKPLWEALNLKSKNPHSVCSSDITTDVMNNHFSTVASKLCSKFDRDFLPGWT